jgi:hypothetical protein
MRGHGSALGAVDQTNRITKETTVRIEVDKANDLVEKPTFDFEIKSVDLDFDAETQRRAAVGGAEPAGPYHRTGIRRAAAELRLDGGGS